MTMMAGQRHAGKRGKLPARPGAIKLKLGTYLNRAKLPALPPHFGHVTNLPPTAQGWGMLGNDMASDCVIAGRCHEVMVDALATHRPVPVFTVGSAMADYSRCLVAAGGPPYNPNIASSDAGLDMQQAAKWWQDVGLTDASGKVHKIDAYVAVETVDDLLLAAYICGSSGCGLALPDSAEQQFEAGQVWDDLKGQPVGGHYVPCVGYMGNHIVFVTWGELQGATKEYVAARMEDGVCCLSREYIGANGLSPELIDWTALLADVAALPGGSAMGEPSVPEQVAEQAEREAAEPPHEPAAEHANDSGAEQIEEPHEEPESHGEIEAPKPRHKRAGNHKPKGRPRKKR